MSDIVRRLKASRTSITKKMGAMLELAGDAGLSDEQKKEYDALVASRDRVDATLAAAEVEAEAARTAPAETVDPVASVARVPAEAKKADDKPFATFGQQLQAIAGAAMNKGSAAGQDPRLVWQAATPSGANEIFPSEGGFLVQRDFSTEMLDLMHGMGELLGRVRRIPIMAGSNGIKLPAIDETSRVNGSRFGGVQAYWTNESDAATASKPKFRMIELNLNKLMAISYATDELLADSAALEAVLKPAFAEELTFKTEDAIFNGDGTGKPLGILNSGALVTVAAESGQTATTVNAQNVLKMWARTPIRSRKNLVWVINQDVEQSLYQMTLGSGTAVVLLYTPPGVNGNNSPYGLLLGRPVIPIEYAATLGTVGDIVLFDPQQYVMIDKNGLQSASSMHVRFLNDEMTFRFTFRVDGQPVWRQALTPFKGTNTISPYVALAAR